LGAIRVGVEQGGDFQFSRMQNGGVINQPGRAARRHERDALVQIDNVGVAHQMGDGVDVPIIGQILEQQIARLRK